MEQKNLKELCIRLEVIYMSKFNEVPVLLQKSDLFPFCWWSLSYEDRYSILKEAIEGNLRIEDTAGYINMMDGVVMDASYGSRR